VAAAADTLVLSASLRRSLAVMAQASPEAEACALLGGQHNVITSVYPVINVAAEPADAFLLDAEEQIAAMKMMREAGESLRGIFHSHPRSPAEPSATDRALAAYPDVYYLIASLLPDPPTLRAWFYDGNGFHEVDIRQS